MSITSQQNVDQKCNLSFIDYLNMAINLSNKRGKND